MKHLLASLVVLVDAIVAVEVAVVEKDPAEVKAGQRKLPPARASGSIHHIY